MNNAFLELLDGASLYSDRTTRNGTFSGKIEYDTNFNKLISPNKTAIAILQQDGNFVVRLGNFNAAGEPMRPDGSYENDPFKYKLYTKEIWSLCSIIDCSKRKTGIDNAPFELVFNSKDGFLIKSITKGLIHKFIVDGITNPSSDPITLFLEDNGIFRIRRGADILWSNVNPERDAAAQKPETQTNTEAAPNMVFNPIFLIAAAAAAFLYLRK